MTPAYRSRRSMNRRSPLARVALYGQALAAWRAVLARREVGHGFTEVEAVARVRERQERALRCGDPPEARAERDAFMDDYVRKAPR